MQRRKNFNTVYKAFFLITAFLLSATALPAADKDPWWWQEEIAPPPDGQIINPEYISKRDELERFWTQTNRDRGLRNQYFRWSNRANVKSENTSRGLSTATQLESALAKIPVYVPRPSDSGSASAAPAQQ